MKIPALLALFALTLASVPLSRAAVIVVDPTKVSQSTELGSFNRVGNYVVDGSGLSGGQHSISPGGTMWLSDFGGSIDPDPWIEFDLGDIYEIDSINVWNYNEGSPDLTNRGVNGVTIQYGITPFNLNKTLYGINNFAKANGLSTYTGELFNSFIPFRARIIRFEIADTPGVGNHGGDSYGLSEVQFTGLFKSRVLPEPGTVGFLGVGLVILGATRRRRLKVGD